MTTMNSQMRQRARRREIREHYPHRVGLPYTFCTYENFHALNRFCLERFGVHPKTEIMYSIWEGFDRGFDMRLYCFATPEQAAEFCAYFDGTPFDEHACQRRGKDRKIWVMPGTAGLPHKARAVVRAGVASEESVGLNLLLRATHV